MGDDDEGGGGKVDTLQEAPSSSRICSISVPSTSSLSMSYPKPNPKP